MIINKFYLLIIHNLTSYDNTFFTDVLQSVGNVADGKHQQKLIGSHHSKTVMPGCKFMATWYNALDGPKRDKPHENHCDKFIIMPMAGAAQ